MNIRASGRSALIIAAGLWLGFAGPMRVTDSAAEPAGQAAQTENAGAPVKLSKYTKHRSHKHHKRHAAHTRKSHKTASKEADAQADKTASARRKMQDSDKHVPLPPTVANANANVEMPGATVDAPKTEADALASNAEQDAGRHSGGVLRIRKLTPRPPQRAPRISSLPTNSTKSTVP